MYAVLAYIKDLQEYACCILPYYAGVCNMPKAKYESDLGTVHVIRLRDVTVGVGGAEPTGAVTSPIIVKTSKSKREVGIRPRGVVIGIDVGTAPNTFVRYAFIPVLTKAAYDGANFQLGSPITYKAGTWEVISRSPEDY